MSAKAQPLKRRLTTALPVAALTLMVALAGCSTAENELNSIPAEADLTYDGANSGSHSDSAACDAEGTIKGSGSIADGIVTVRITDGEDQTVFERSYDQDFDMGKIRLDGHSGSWTLHADRDGNDLAGDAFNGDYGFFLNCQAF